MEALFLKLLNMSITAGWIVLAVVLLRLLLKKAPKWISCLLWVLVGLRLILPFSFESKVSVVPSTETVPQEIIYSQAPTINSGVPFVNNSVNPVISESLAPEVGASVNPIQIVIFVATIVWCIGVAGMLIYALISYLRVKHKVRISAPLRENIYICDNIGTPFILGVFKPKIYLPSELPEREAEYVIAHEKSHLKRRDHLWKPIGFALLTVYWFNPLLWLGYVLLCRDIELACDERVIKNMDAEEKKAYSTALLDCSIPRRMISACPLAFGEVDVKNRIKSVLNYKKPAFWIIVVAIIACIVAAVCLLTDPKREKDEVVSSADTVENSDVSDTDIGTNEKYLEGVSISVKEQKLYSGIPYIEIEWTNGTDECMIFRDAFTLYYKDGDTWVDSSTAEISYGTTRYALPPNDTVVRKYYLSYNDLRKKEYQFSAEYFPSERPSEIYTASVCFELGGIVDPMVTNDYQTSSVVYASSQLSSPDDLGVGTKYRAVTHYGGIALYRLNSVNEYDYIGVIYYTELTEDNFDYLFSEGFKRSGLSAEKLRRENHKFYIAGDEENRLHILLFQNDGSAYLVTGYYDEKNKGNSYAERVYELTTPAMLSYEDVVSGEEESNVYKFYDSIDIIEPEITLYGNGEFQFIYSGLSSYIGWGSYILTEDTLTLPTSDGMYVYVFDVTSEGFRFDAERSSELQKFRYHPDEEAQTPVPDGALFEGDMIYPEPVAVVKSDEEILTLTKSSIPKTSDWKTVGLESAGLGEASFYSSTESSLGTLHILTHYSWSRVLMDIFFALERDDDVLLYSVTDLSIPEYLYFCDIDGDKTDEIIFMVDNGGNGGAGSHTTYVWKVTDEGFETLMALNGYVTYFDTGFEFELQASFKLLVKNRHTGYSRTIDFSNRSGYIGAVYNEMGNPAVTWTAYHDCFYYIVPCDIDNDGVYEIECTAYTSLYDHADGIGDSICTLKYDRNSKSFKVVDARFEVYDYVAQEFGVEKLCTVSRNSNRTYSCEIKDFEGNVIHTVDNIPKEPETERVSDAVVKVSSQGGTGLSTQWTQYFNVLTGEKSDVFYYVLCERSGKVIYADFEDGKSRIIVQDIFDKDAFYKVCPIAVPCAAADFAKDVEFSYDGTAVITCINSEGEEFLIAVDTTNEIPLSEYYPFPLTVDEGEKVYEANEFYIALYRGLSEYGFEFAVLDVNGNILVEQHDEQKRHELYMVSDSVLCVYMYGDGIYTSETVYYNVYTGQISPTYYAAFEHYGNNVLYPEYDKDTGSNSIIVRDFFDENVFYKKIPITKNFSAPFDAVQDVYVSSSGIATVTFFKDHSNTLYEIKIDMTK